MKFATKTLSIESPVMHSAIEFMLMQLFECCSNEVMRMFAINLVILRKSLVHISMKFPAEDIKEPQNALYWKLPRTT